MNMKSMKKAGGLRKRWLLNTVGVVFALGLVCVMAVTAFSSQLLLLQHAV